MARKPFTDAEMMQLADNPYTYKVTRGQISFTAEFKKDFWDKRCAGRTVEEAFRECGYDPDVLGSGRMRGTAEMIRTQNKNGEEPHSGRRPYGALKARSRQNKERDIESEVADLQHRVEFLEKQIDFLKRIAPARTLKQSVNS